MPAKIVAPAPSPEGILPTLNDYGSTSIHIADYAQKFIDIAAASRRWVLDVGCAYGVHSLAAVKAGGKVVANDLDARHLRLLRQSVPPELQLNLRTRKGAFPRIALPDSAFDAVLASAVLHFMDGDTVERCARKIKSLLAPDGKVIALVMSPYLRYMEPLLPLYEQRKQEGHKWPGYFADLRQHFPSWAGRPKALAINFMEPETLARPFAEAGFVVEVAAPSTVNSTISLHGFGASLLIARKP